MGLFKTDLYRSFAVGFVLGAAALFVSLGGDARSELAGKVIPVAQAAPASAAPFVLIK